MTDPVREEMKDKIDRWFLEVGSDKRGQGVGEIGGVDEDNLITDLLHVIRGHTELEALVSTGLEIKERRVCDRALTHTLDSCRRR